MQLRIHNLVHFTQISTSVRTASELNEISALQSKLPESLLPFIGEAVRGKPDQHTIELPLRAWIAYGCPKSSTTRTLALSTACRQRVILFLIR